METNDPSPARGWYNDQSNYGRLSQSFHWIIAILMVSVVTLGLFSQEWPRGHATRDSILFVHKSIGLALLILATARLSWLLRSPAPEPAAGLKLWERRLAWIVHKLLYFLMFAMPLSGILLSQAAGKELPFFGLFSIPALLTVDTAAPISERPLLQWGVFLHKEVFTVTLYFVFALHFAGALKHIMVDRNPAMFRRMWGK